MPAIAAARHAARQPLSREDRAILRALRITEARWRDPGPAFRGPDTSADFFRLRLAGRDTEAFDVAFLDTAHRLIAAETLFTGGVDGAEVHVRVVAQRALAHNAAALLVAHNHPSGIAVPSAADLALTHRLHAALALFDIRLLDHLIVGRDVHSMQQAGEMPR